MRIGKAGSSATYLRWTISSFLPLRFIFLFLPSIRCFSPSLSCSTSRAPTQRKCRLCWLLSLGADRARRSAEECGSWCWRKHQIFCVPSCSLSQEVLAHCEKKFAKALFQKAALEKLSPNNSVFQQTSPNRLNGKDEVTLPHQCWRSHVPILN